MPLIEETDKATRLARAIASDIALYNEDKVKTGIAQDRFFEHLASELDEGRELYLSRVAPELDGQAALFWLAVVNVIIRPKAHIQSKMW